MYIYIKRAIHLSSKGDTELPFPSPPMVHDQVAHYQLAVGFACCELRSQHDRPNVLLYCVPSMSVTNKAQLLCASYVYSSLCNMPSYVLVPENFVHNPGLLSVYCDVTFSLAIVFQIRESMTSQ